MLKTLLYIISGLFLIAAAVCAGIFYHHGSIQTLGGTLMFLCFGAFGMFIGFNLDTLKPQTSWQPSAQRR